jgi:hypothetical protein
MNNKMNKDEKLWTEVFALIESGEYADFPDFSSNIVN